MIVRSVKHGSSEYKEEVNLRHEILRKPLGLQFTEEQLREESTEYHLCGFDNGRIVGCVLLRPIEHSTVVRMRQMAVNESVQRRGIGSYLLSQAEEFAKKQNFTEVVVHARVTAIPFYLKAGYYILSDETFTEVNIPHNEMRKKLI